MAAQRPAEVRIIPVIDLSGGRAVRAVAGRRAEYQPIESVLTADSSPQSIAQAYQRCGFLEAYLADLDAIGGEPPAWNLLRRMAECGLQLYLDAGIANAQRAAELALFEPALTAIIAGLESVPSPSVLREVISIIEPERLVFSLDLKQGVPQVVNSAWQGMSPIEIALAAIELGVQRLIILDLAQVGRGVGVGTEPICRQLRAAAPGVEIIAGGGVRGLADVRALGTVGCNAVLVASALHDGRITAAMLDDFRRQTVL